MSPESGRSTSTGPTAKDEEERRRVGQTFGVVEDSHGEWLSPLIRHARPVTLKPLVNPTFSPPLPPHVSFAYLNMSDLADHPLRQAELAFLGDRVAINRRNSFQLGRGAARLALEGLGVEPASIPRGDFGEPIWPPDMVGTITHSGDHALAAVAERSSCRGIGMDLERFADFQGLADQVAFGDELDWLNSLSTVDRQRGVIEIFSAKESIFKAFFPRVNRYFGFEAAGIAEVAGMSYRLGRLLEPIDNAYPATRTFRIDTEWYNDLVLSTVVLPSDE